jgi:hypothetical protein
MTNAKLERKFVAAAKGVLPQSGIDAYLATIRSIEPWAMRACWLARRLRHDAAPAILGAAAEAAGEAKLLLESFARRWSVPSVRRGRPSD